MLVLCYLCTEAFSALGINLLSSRRHISGIASDCMAVRPDVLRCGRSLDRRNCRLGLLQMGHAFGLGPERFVGPSHVWPLIFPGLFSGLGRRVLFHHL